MIRLFQHVFLLGACIIFCGAATRYLVADAFCELRMNYTGNLTADPTWVVNSAWCKPSDCPVSGKCTLIVTSSSTTQIVSECQCPSGGGSSGCKGVQKTNLDVNADPTSSKLVCSGGCDANEVCDWATAAVPPGKAGTWARCHCALPTPQ